MNDKLTATLSDAGVLSIAGAGHVIVRQAGDVLVVQGGDAPLKFTAAKSIDVDIAGFADLHGVTLPHTIRNAYDADRWAPYGYSVADVNQRMSPDCGHEAALAGWIAAGGRPSITYAGPTATGARYLVRVGTRQDVVEFDGTLLPLDQFIRRPGTFWNLLEHRAFKRHATTPGSSMAIADLRGGGELAQLNVRSYIPAINPGEIPANRNAIFAALQQGLATGQICVAETHFSVPGPYYGYGWVSPFIVADHQYTILRAYMIGNTRYLRIRNPWGRDNFTNKTQGDPNDGILELPFEECLRSFQTVRIG